MFSRGAYPGRRGAIFKTKGAPRMGSILSDTQTPVVATQTVVVYDEVQRINRRVIAGQPVPPDLLAAYRDVVGEIETPPGTPDVDVDAPYRSTVDQVVPGEPRVAIVESNYDDADKEALEAEVERRRSLGRTIEVEGSGSGGNVVKGDLVAALEDDDENGGDA